MSDPEEPRDMYLKSDRFIHSQEPPPGTDLHDGSYCWKCNGTGYLYEESCVG